MESFSKTIKEKALEKKRGRGRKGTMVEKKKTRQAARKVVKKNDERGEEDVQKSVSRHGKVERGATFTTLGRESGPAERGGI